MHEERLKGKRNGASGGREPNPECLVIRDEIMTVASGQALVVSEIVTAHLEKCGSCREWEADYRNMHGLCRDLSAASDASSLTASAIRTCGRGPVRSAAERAGEARARLEVRDRGALFVVSLAVVLFNLILAFSLEGSARVMYPTVLFLCMLGSAVSVHADAGRRKMPAAFWAAIAAFTLPLGIAAYLVCRARGSSRCPACGRTVSANDRFCHACGGALAELCCGCGRAVRKEFRVCPFCGTSLDECFPSEDRGKRSCGWSRAQILFAAAVNAAFVVVFLASLLRGGPVVSRVVPLLVFFGWIPLFNWVAIDSRRRAMPTVLWGIFVLVTMYAGLVIYLACRRDERVECPVCGSYPPVSFNYCPCCGSVLGAVCASCGAPVARGNRFCASCGTARVSADASPQSRG
ncbi:MAG TPA: zinc ribbon domain-containing protein [Candidatus Bathyarchaeia archaeon]|nr:zinc ribbon domain-containing protein [Candidatus Bathyarchaeia archaeon]